MDQLVSPIDDFVPTYHESPIINHYIFLNVFVDNFSNFTYVQLMTETNGETMVDTKKVFGQIAATHHIEISHYHSEKTDCLTPRSSESLHKKLTKHYLFKE